MMAKFRLFIIIVVFSISSVSSIGEEKTSVRIKYKKSHSKLLSEYQKVHKKYFYELCSGGVEQNYWKLVKNYKGNGTFVPVLVDGSLDKQTLRFHFHHFDKKLGFIDKNIELLKIDKAFEDKRDFIRKLRKDMDSLVDLKMKYYFAEDIKSKTEIRTKSNSELSKFIANFSKFSNSIYFLKSYDFPVNHFELRKRYDQFKKRKDIQGKRKSNEIYFYRKLTEDGAYNNDLSGSDMFMRTLFSMVTYRLREKADFLFEEIRYDLDSLFKMIDKHLRRGRHAQIRRMKEWKRRTNRQKSFYVSLLEDKVQIGKDYKTTEEFIKKKSVALHELKEFVYQKQVKAYNFWTSQPEIMRYLFVMDTILYNEVGNLDGRDALERRDVAKVVLNRHAIDFYSSLSPQGPLSDLFIQYEDLSKYRWLNILFREGEFSFTYYFIPATVRLFCPDQTRLGRMLRKENVNIGLDLVNEDLSDFPAVRYFSRASMLGRINMAKLWTDFIPIQERIGKNAPRSHFLAGRVKKGFFKYLYHFTSPDGLVYKVAEIADRNYVLPLDDSEVFKYRDPNMFRYFKNK